MNREAAARLRTFLLDSGFTTDGVLARVGAEAFAALGRDLVVPIRRVLELSRPTVLDRLIEVFLLADPIPLDALVASVLDDLEALGMVRRDIDRVTPLVEVHPYGEPDTDWFIVSDIGAPSTPDHVLGLGGASLTLARITPRRDGARTMDLGCGAGIQTLHAARHSDAVVATDTNPRALELTALSAALSGVPEGRVQLLEGSLFDPVADERFDLVVSNPPFVISPSHRFTYRDGGMPGDELSRSVVRGAAAHLAVGGMAAVLGNWMHVQEQDWRERVTDWVSGTGVDAWIVERDSQAVADYAATWLRDAQVPEGPEFDAAMGEWLDAFAAEGCVEVGFGWIVLIASDQQGDPAPSDPRAPWVLVEDLAHSARLPRGDEVLAFLGGCEVTERLTAPHLLAARFQLSEAATITTTTRMAAGSLANSPPRLGLTGVVGVGGWRPAIPVPPALVVALLEDPAQPIGDRLDAAAEAEGLDPLDILGPALMGLRELVRMGIVRTE